MARHTTFHRHRIPPTHRRPPEGAAGGACRPDSNGGRPVPSGGVDKPHARIVLSHAHGGAHGGVPRTCDQVQQRVRLTEDARRRPTAPSTHAARVVVVTSCRYSSVPSVVLGGGGGRRFSPAATAAGRRSTSLGARALLPLALLSPLSPALPASPSPLSPLPHATRPPPDMNPPPIIYIHRNTCAVTQRLSHLSHGRRTVAPAPTPTAPTNPTDQTRGRGHR